MYGLSAQPPLDDDVAFVVTAYNYMEHGQPWPSMNNQPFLRNTLLYYSTQALGTGPWGVWGVSLFLGILSLALLALICRELFEQRTIALLAVFFFSLDPLHIAFSRQSIREATSLFFILAGVYTTLLYTRKRTAAYLIATGIAFGLGMATKWLPFFPFLLCGLWIVWLEAGKSSGRVLQTLVILLLLPLAIYVLTYLPWFSRGYGLMDWIGLQKAFLYMNVHHDNPLSSAIHNSGNPLLWFVWFVGYGSFGYAAGNPVVSIGMGNYLVWILTIPSVLYLAYVGLKERNRNAIFATALFAVAYLQAIIASFTRDIYVLSALTVAPFAFIAIAFSLVRLMQHSKWKKQILAMYLVTVAFVSVLMYPLSTSRALEYAYLRPIVDHYNPHREDRNSPYQREAQPESRVPNAAGRP